jgi:DNA-directed RNA polymerase subunit RPC12/RpoP
VTTTAGPSAKMTRLLRLTYRCSQCRVTNRQAISAEKPIHCSACGWTRTAREEDFNAGAPGHCLVCGCDDLWRQKDFPQRLGLLMVGAGIALSTIAYALWYPTWALGVLMFFALADALLFLFMRDVLVCYRCGARHTGFELTESTQLPFDLEVAERYRQERLRLEAARRPT